MSSAKIVLCGVSPDYQHRCWESDTILRIGRLDSLEMFLDDGSISRRHAEILATEHGWMIRDLGSTNGTFINGMRVGRTDQRLKQGDVINVGLIYVNVDVLHEAIRHVPAPAPIRVKIDASTSRPWDAALIEMDQRQRASTGENKCLLHLRTGYHACHSESLTELLMSILEDAVTVLDAAGGAIILASREGDRLDFGRVVAIPESRKNGGRLFSKTLCQRAFDQGESLLARNSRELETADAEAAESMAYLACGLLRSPRRRMGVIHLDRSAEQGPFSADDIHLIDSISAAVSTSIESAVTNEDQRELFYHTVSALAQAVETRDRYTGGHTQRVTAYSLLIADELKLPAAQRYLLQLGVPLHDVGKIGIEDRVLSKTGGLTSEETEHMKSHVLKGVAILETIPALAPVIPIVRHHHERWDGTGYPDGLTGEAIPMLARIAAVADAFDAMTTDRPYRKALSLDSALDVLRGGAYSQFDPECVVAIVRLAPRLKSLLAEEAALKRLSEAATKTSPQRNALRHVAPAVAK